MAFVLFYGRHEEGDHDIIHRFSFLLEHDSPKNELDITHDKPEKKHENQHRYRVSQKRRPFNLMYVQRVFQKKKPVSKNVKKDLITQ